MKKVRITFICISIILFLLWLIPIVKNDVLTMVHGKEFEGKYSEGSTMMGELEHLRVISYNCNGAKVYYFGTGGGFLFHFDSDGQIIYDECIWSDGGSADNFIWPYWYHSPTGVGLFIIFGIPLFVILFVTYIIAIHIAQKRENKQ